MIWIVEAFIAALLFSEYRFWQACALTLGMILITVLIRRPSPQPRPNTASTTAALSTAHPEIIRLTQLWAELGRAEQAGLISAKDFSEAQSRILKRVRAHYPQRLDQAHQEMLHSQWVALNLRDPKGELIASPWAKTETAHDEIQGFSLDDEINQSAAAPSPSQSLPQVRSPHVASAKPMPKAAEAAPVQPKTIAEPKRKAQPKPKPVRKAWFNLPEDFFSKLLLPFLWQNIGWFIGTFLVISGSVFFVTYTTGYIKALAVVATLSSYTALLFWGAYQIRKRQPKLYLTSLVVSVLAVSLVPLIFAATTRLLLTADSSLGMGLGLLSAVFVVGGAYFGLKLAAGLIDRCLLPEQPRLLLYLSALQFSLPVLALWTHPAGLIVVHALLLLGLAYALRRFAQHWLQSIFIDQRKIAWYAAGSLIYAALVSFIHLSISAPVALPAGYSTPFLLALCGLLFYADSHIQQWVEKAPRLHYFSFVLYALSAAALLPAWFVGDELALSLSLLLASALYGAMLWRYLSLPPFYLLLGSSAALYYLHILQPQPVAWHFLLSLPGLAALFLLYRRVQKHPRGERLALMIYRSLVGLLLALVVWSLLPGQLGWGAMVTPFSAALILLYLIGMVPEDKRHPYLQRLTQYRCYLVMALFALSLAYMPLWFELWSQQFSLALFGLALVNLGASLWIRSRRCDAEALRNVGLLGMMAALLLALDLPMPEPALMFLAVGLSLLFLADKLRLSLLLYISLALIGLALSALRYHFGLISTGSSAALGSLGAGLLWWLLERREAMQRELDLIPERPAERLRLLWYFNWRPQADRLQLWLDPAWQLCVGMWLVGIFKLISFYQGPNWLPSSGATVAVLLSLASIWIAGQAQAMPRGGRFMILLPIAFGLLLLAIDWISPLPAAWQALQLAVSAVLLWGATILLLPALQGVWTRLGWTSEKKYRHPGAWWVEYSLHWAVIAGLALALWLLAQLDNSQTTLSPSLIFSLSAGFFWLATRRYQLLSHAYLCLLFIVLAALAWTLWLFGGFWNFAPDLSLLLLIGLTAAFAMLGWRLSAQNLYVRPLYHAAYLLYIVLPLYLLIQAMALGLGSVALGVAAWAWLSLPVFMPRRDDEVPYLLSDYAAELRSLMWPLALLLGTLLALDEPYLAAFGTQMILVFAAASAWLWAHYGLPRWNAWAECCESSGLEEAYRGHIGSADPNWDAPAKYHQLRWFEVLYRGHLGSAVPLLWTGLGLLLFGLLPDVLYSQADPALYAQLTAKLPASLSAALGPVLGFLLTLSHWSPLLLLATALYLLLMQAHIALRSLAWGSGLALTLGLIVLCLNLFPLQAEGGNTLLVFALLLSLNTLLWLSGRELIANRSPYLNPAFAHALYLLPSLLLSTWLVLVSSAVVFGFGSTLWHGNSFNASGLALALSAALALSMAHIVWLRPHWLSGNLLVWALLPVCVLAGSSAGLAALWIMNLWLALLALLYWQRPRYALLASSLSWWLGLSFALGLEVLLVQVRGDLLNWPAWSSLLLMGFTALFVARCGLRAFWWLGLALLWLVAHWLWPLLLPEADWLSLGVWFALQNMAAAWLLNLLARRKDNLQGQWHSMGALLSIFSFFALIVHLLLFTEALWLGNAGFSWWAHAALLLTVLLFSHSYFSHAWARSSLQVYALALLWGLVALYLRLAVWGLAAPNVWDTALLISAALVLVLLPRLLAEAYRPALGRLVLLLPALALLTVPLQWASLHSSLSLFAIGGFYLVAGREASQRISGLLGLLALNLGFYLWVPLWAEQWQLMQLYTVPAALSILLMLQLHILELRPNLRHKLRLTALALLYVSAALDVFLRPELSIFMLAVGLSLAGVLLGMLLRVRAFLYTGVIALVVNVCGQLVNFYADDTLGKGVILVLLGAVIIGGMIIFSIQREAILQRIRLVRADLAEWE